MDKKKFIFLTASIFILFSGHIVYGEDRKVTKITGMISYGSLDSSIASEDGEDYTFLTDSKIGKEIFDKCNVTDECTIYAITDEYNSIDEVIDKNRYEGSHNAIDNNILSGKFYKKTTSFDDNNTILIKKSIFNEKSTTTIGDTFLNIFDNTTWRSINKDGRIYVYFTGNITQKTHDMMISEIGKNFDIFKIDELKKTFHKKMNPYEENYKNVKENLGGLKTKKENECFALRNELDNINNDHGGESINFLNDKIITLSDNFDRSKNEISSFDKKIISLRGKINDLKSMKPADVESIIRKKYELFHEQPLSSDEIEKFRDETILAYENDIVKTNGLIDFWNQNIQEIDVERNKYKDKYDKIKLKKLEIEKKEHDVCGEYSLLDKQYISSYNESTKALSVARDEILSDLRHVAQNKYIFPVGSQVEFEWIIFPNRQNFEIKNIQCETLQGEQCAFIYMLAVRESLRR